MDFLEKAYNKIIEMYDPYYQPEESDVELTTSDMIYNLSCILQDLNADEDELRAMISNVLEFAK